MYNKYVFMMLHATQNKLMTKLKNGSAGSSDLNN